MVSIVHLEGLNFNLRCLRDPTIIYIMRRIVKLDIVFELVINLPHAFVVVVRLFSLEKSLGAT